MPKFRKKPIIIEAVQYTCTQDSMDEIRAWLGAGRGAVEWDTGGDHISIRTLEGIHRASPGDWLIRGIKGELYPCKPDIFEATYEAVAEA